MGGVAKARNYGLAKATGDYVLFLDADDFVSADFIEQLFIVFNKTSSDVICWGYDTVNENQHVIRKYFKHYNPPVHPLTGMQALEAMILKNTFWIWTGSAAYKRSLLLDKNLYYHENCKNGEDQEFTFKALFHSKQVIFIHKILSYYTQREGSISNTYDLRRFDAIEAMERVCAMFEDNNFKQGKVLEHEIKFNRMIDIYFSNLQSCIAHMEKQEYKNLLHEIDRIYPGLNNHMVRIVKQYNGKVRIVFIKTKIFSYSPLLFMKIYRAFHQLYNMKRSIFRRGELMDQKSLLKANVYKVVNEFSKTKHRIFDIK